MLKDLDAKEENDDIPEDVVAEKTESVPKFGTPHEKWNLSGSIYDCLKRYADQLSDQQIDEIITGMEQGLSDRQIKAYFYLSAEKMSQYMRGFAFENRVKGGKV